MKRDCWVRFVGCLLLPGCSSGVDGSRKAAEGVAETRAPLEAPLVWPEHAIAATNSVWVEAGGSVRGSIATTLDGTDPLFDDVEVSIGLDADVEGSVVGDAVRVALGATVTGDVHYNALTNHGTVQGELVTPLALPLPSTCRSCRPSRRARPTSTWSSAAAASSRPVPTATCVWV